MPHNPLEIQQGLAKAVFTVHGVDAAGQVVLRKTVRREKLMELIAALPPCRIGIEACTGAHEWARQFVCHGHQVGIMMARFVAAYRKSSKNDGNDAEAICEAVGRPNMRFVPVKTVEQQAILTLHRVRRGFIEERTATINRIRGLLAEFGVVLPQRAEQVRRAAVVAAEVLPLLSREAIAELRAHLSYLDERINRYERQLVGLAKTHEPARRVQGVPGVGPLTASAITASIATGHEFASGRQFAAWLGLVPRQYSTGGKAKLGRITKRGDAYLRTLLMLGARAVLQSAAQKTDRLSRWAMAVRARRGYHRAIIAVAAKNARIIWALPARHQDFALAPELASSGNDLYALHRRRGSVMTFCRSVSVGDGLPSGAVDSTGASAAFRVPVAVSTSVSAVRLATFTSDPPPSRRRPLWTGALAKASSRRLAMREAHKCA